MIFLEKARDYYSNKLLIAQEVKGIYQQTISAIDKKFICPECGEYVAFVSGNKKKPYFRHCNSNEYTKNCDFRTQTQTYSSIYEKLGLPMYIKKVGENYYELFIGFYKIEEYILKLAEDLVCVYKLQPGVVNVLIDYILKTNNNKLTRGLAETIAGQWQRQKIETVDEAMRLAEKEHKKYKKGTTTTKLRVTREEKVEINGMAGIFFDGNTFAIILSLYFLLGQMGERLKPHPC